MRVLRKLARTRLSDWMDIVRAYVYLLRAGWKVFVRRQRLDRWLSNNRAAADLEPITDWEQARVDRAVSWTARAGRYPVPWARCLQSSLAALLWLESLGIRTTLRLGVRRDGDGIDAHAWLQYKGQVVNDVSSVGEVFAILESTTAYKSESNSRPQGIES